MIAWPKDGLEHVLACPICGERTRTLVHAGLCDGMRERPYAEAPGTWDLQRCISCGSGYLDPRPYADTIALAYSRVSKNTPALDQGKIRRTTPNCDSQGHRMFGPSWLPLDPPGT